jgi:hypothetical protein
MQSSGLHIAVYRQWMHFIPYHSGLVPARFLGVPEVRRFARGVK